MDKFFVFECLSEDGFKFCKSWIVLLFVWGFGSLVIVGVIVFLGVVYFFIDIVWDFLSLEVMNNYELVVMMCVYVGDGFLIVEFVKEWCLFVFFEVILD